MSKKTIWGNCIVKNEDKYLWFAIKSTINYLDKIIIWDTGSTDDTVEIIKLLQKEYPEKIIFKEIGNVDAAGLTEAREKMLQQTKSDWLLLIDGDEVWWEKTLLEVTQIINTKGNDLYAIVTPVINLVGDIFHYQSEEAGEYKIGAKKGHFNIRAINRKIPGLHIKNDYPLEGFFDKNDVLIQNMDQKWLSFSKNPLLHFTHLSRSSLDNQVMQRQKKMKYEMGIKFANNFQYPEALNLNPPSIVSNPWQKMSSQYKFRAFLETPFKKIKRKIWKNL